VLCSWTTRQGAAELEAGLEADRLTSRMRCCRKVRRAVVAGCVFRVRGSRRCGFSEGHLPYGGWCAGCGCGELRNRPLGLFQRSRGLRGRRPPRRLTGAGNLQQARFPNARKAQQTHVPKVRKMQQQRVLNVQNSSPACPSTLPPGRPPGRTPPPAGFSRP
jgi:hypothetical protein